jgi:GT2 family glycosyltransferase
VTRRASALTAACLLLRKADYEAVGGMNAADFPVAFNDVDLCLKLTHQLGKYCVWTPDAVLYHHESVSRGKEDLPEKQARAAREIAALRHHWGDELLRDPAYNPNLNLDALAGAHQGLAFPPRERTWR